PARGTRHDRDGRRDTARRFRGRVARAGLAPHRQDGDDEPHGLVPHRGADAGVATPSMPETRTTHWRIAGTGGTNHLTLHSIEGQALSGTVRGTGALRWG